MNNKIIEVHVEKVGNKAEARDIYEARAVVADASISGKDMKSDVTIIVQAYNNIEKTKRCVESIIKYTEDVDYDLLLIDNGSESDTLEYFKSINIDKKSIVRVDNNIGSAFPGEVISLNMLSKYVAYIANDIIVTKNWLSNMLKVMESDTTIGLVNPVCSNTNNYQCVELAYKDYDDMQKKAENYNISDKTKWEERIRILTLGHVLRKECIYAIGWPINDFGFMHDFMDDDMSFRIRRAGYKIVLARDTWICHDHPYSERNMDKLIESLDIGRTNFQQKYYGIDAWNDVNNYISPILGDKIKDVGVDNVAILGIDVKCGTPILDIKNEIRKYGIYDAELSAFTREEKYTVDLKTICDGIVVCDREEYITRKLPFEYYDYIIIGKEINAYYEPINVLLDAYMVLKKGGQLIFSLHNTNNVFALLRMLGYDKKGDKEYFYDYPMNQMFRDLKKMNVNVSFFTSERVQSVANDVKELAKSLLESYAVENGVNEMYERLMADKLWFSIEK